MIQKIVAVMMLSLFPHSIYSAEWGTVEGRVKVVGEVQPPPELKTIGDHTIPDSSILIGKEGGLANCFVYLYQRKGQPEIHPDLQEPDPKIVKFEMQDIAFEPRCLILRTDQKLHVYSKGVRPHGLHTFFLRNQHYSSLIGQNDAVGEIHEYPIAEPLPTMVTDEINPWLRGYWMMTDHPYATVTDTKGKFSIEKVPAGIHTFRIWHERVGYIERTLEVEIENNKVTDLGTIMVQADDLKK
ncbi:hypothetical protein [Rubinisphaera sp.]|uniref:hypothetical protein n=1 Tax=Rubinisphaera sp. TaxID=2024857 RepID=UPI000C103C3F|nr:hypothetical protein [Rubinisphaera sp.]MBV10364.1 hypothetical protein [Rubinisphaera sp.]HCS51265.1 hypothetical protein [Planctomycetaceae bacterium]